MYYNAWIILFIGLFISTSVYCGKREFFDQKVQYNQNGERYIEYTDSDSKITTKSMSEVNLGAKYTIEEVNKAVHSIIEYFGTKYDVNISITKIMSIKKSSGKMELRMFIYNPILNVILGYTVTVNIPFNSKKNASVQSVQPFSKTDVTTDKHTSFDVYSNINFIEGNFT